jgi:hypothetical protein
VLKQPAKLGPVAFRATDLFFEDPGAAGLAQCASLLCEILALGGHSGIAYQWPDFDLPDHVAPVAIYIAEFLTLATKIIDMQKPYGTV